MIIENEKVDSILPDIINDIEEEKIDFLTHLKKAESVYAISA